MEDFAISLLVEKDDVTSMKEVTSEEMKNPDTIMNPLEESLRDKTYIIVNIA